MKYFLLLVLSIPTISFGQETLFPQSPSWRFFKPNRLSIVGGRLINNRDHFLRPHIDDGEWRHNAALEFDVDLATYRKYYGFYWNNIVHSEITDTPRQIGWEWEFGFSFGKRFQVFHQHHSRHVTEHHAEYSPLYDSYGARFTFFGNGK